MDTITRFLSTIRSSFARGFRGRYLNILVMSVLAIAWFTPLFGLILTSLRDRIDAQTSGWWTALLDPGSEQWTASNFGIALERFSLGDGFLNSLAVAVPSTILPITIAAFAAYTFTFLDFRGKEIYFGVIVGLLIIPIQVTMIPILRSYIWFEDLTGIEVSGTFPGIWLVHSAFALPLATYILRNFMSTLPGELIEAARVDGASYLTIFWRIVVPMSVPALAAFAIFQFLWVWNDLLVAQIFLGSDKQVLTQGLLGLLGRYGQGWQQVGAGSLIALIVPLIVFLLLQRYFVRGLTAGSLKA